MEIGLFNETNENLDDKLSLMEKVLLHGLAKLNIDNVEFNVVCTLPLAVYVPKSVAVTEPVKWSPKYARPVSLNGWLGPTSIGLFFWNSISEP